jgi:hypothetical protein
VLIQKRKRTYEVVELYTGLKFVSTDGTGTADFNPSRDAQQAEEMAARCQDVVLAFKAYAAAVVGVLILLFLYTIW